MTSFVLKLIAALSMLADHTGLILFPKIGILRIIGRLAFPIYAYCIAEGFRYTKNRRKYFLRIFLLGLICQTVYFIADRELYLGILITFSVSIGILACLDAFKRSVAGEDSFVRSMLGKRASRTAEVTVSALLLILSVTGAFLLSSKVTVDYGFFGIMVPPLVYLFDGRWPKLGMLTLGLVMLAYFGMGLGSIQWYSLLAVPVIALYNGKPGKHRMKYFFYIFYPAHLALLYLIAQFVR